MAVPRHQDLLSRAQSPQQHAVDHARGPVDSQETAVRPVKPGCQLFRFPDAALRMVDIVQFGHERHIALQSHIPHQMAQGRIRPPASFMARGMQGIDMAAAVRFYRRQ